MKSCPVLESERLRLRPHRLTDLDAEHALWSDPVVLRYTLKTPSSRQDVWMRILRYGGLWSYLDFGYWVVEEKSSGLFVGEVGFADFKRELKPSIEGEPELGWVLLPEFHGRGYATEALKLALAWADAEINHARTVAIIDPANVASIRVAEKLGFLSLGMADFKGEDTLLFERRRKA